MKEYLPWIWASIIIRETEIVDVTTSVHDFWEYFFTRFHEILWKYKVLWFSIFFVHLLWNFRFRILLRVFYSESFPRIFNLFLSHIWLWSVNWPLKSVSMDGLSIFHVRTRMASFGNFHFRWPFNTNTWKLLYTKKDANFVISRVQMLFLSYEWIQHTKDPFRMRLYWAYKGATKKFLIKFTVTRLNVFQQFKDRSVMTN